MCAAAPPQQPIVIVDSNAFVHGAWRLDSPPWKVLLHQARSGHIRLVIPEIVVREAVGRFAAEAENRLRDVDGAARKLNQLTGEESASSPDVAVTDMVALYRTRLRQRLLECKVDIVGLPETNLDDLVQRAILRTKPFDEKGSGFRDAILWETVVADLRANPDRSAALISNDRRAFGDPSRERSLHPELQTQLADRDLSGTLELFESVAAYLDAAGIGDPDLIARMLEDVQLHQDELAGFASAGLRGEELASASGRVSAQIADVEDVRVLLGRVSASSEEEGLSLAHLIVEAAAHVDLRLEEQETVTVSSISAPLRVVGTAIYRPTDRRFADMRLDELPSVEEVPPVLAELRTLDPSSFAAARLPPDLIEQLQQATLPSQRVIEQLQQATLPSQRVIEQLQQAILPSQELIEQLYRMSYRWQR